MVWIYHSLVKEGLKKLTEIFSKWVANPGLSVLEPFQILLNKLVMQYVPKQNHKGEKYNVHISIETPAPHCTVRILYPCMYSCTYLTADNGQGLQVHHKLTERHDLHFFFKLSYKLQRKVRCVCTYVHIYIAFLLHS